MDKVTIELDAKWVRQVNSPYMHIVWAFQGVAITFAPLFLFWAGTGNFFSGYKLIVVPLCFAAVYLIPMFYYRLGAAVIKELRKQSLNDHRKEDGSHSEARLERVFNYCPDCGAGEIVLGKDGKCTNCGYTLVEEVLKNPKGL
jgi:hypothetical protein